MPNKAEDRLKKKAIIQKNTLSRGKAFRGESCFAGNSNAGVWLNSELLALWSEQCPTNNEILYVLNIYFLQIWEIGSEALAVKKYELIWKFFLGHFTFQVRLIIGRWHF